MDRARLNFVVSHVKVISEYLIDIRCLDIDILLLLNKVNYLLTVLYHLIGFLKVLNDIVDLIVLLNNLVSLNDKFIDEFVVLPGSIDKFSDSLYISFELFGYISRHYKVDQHSVKDQNLLSNR